MKNKITFLAVVAMCIYTLPSQAIPLKTVQKISSEQANSLQSVGSISVSGVRGGPSDAIKKMKDKAAEKGTNYIRIISLGTPSDSSYWMGNAEIYR